MSFSLRQSGDMRRPPLEVSVEDFRRRASAGFSFWRGLAVGLVAGLTISYGLFGGILGRVWG